MKSQIIKSIFQDSDTVYFREKHLVPVATVSLGMSRFSFLLDTCTPGSVPDPLLIAAMLDLVRRGETKMGAQAFRAKNPFKDGEKSLSQRIEIASVSASINPSRCSALCCFADAFLASNPPNERKRGKKLLLAP